MSKRLFVFDIDNTLLPFGEHAIPDKELAAIRALLSQGDYVAIDSGRNVQGISQWFPADILERIFIVSADGTRIYGPGGELLDAHSLSMRDLLNVNKRHEGPGLSVYAYGADNVLYYFTETRFTRHEIEANRFSAAVEIKDAGMFDPDKEILKMILARDGGLLPSDELTEEESRLFTSGRSYKEMLEVSPKGINKASGIKFLIKHLNVDPDGVYVFGDADNDAEMLSLWHGIAMGNGTEVARRSAEIIAPDCRDDGVYLALKDTLKAIKI
jgi:Cof subfamily protein (haloacid dehalogenase superfamily)